MSASPARRAPAAPYAVDRSAVARRAERRRRERHFRRRRRDLLEDATAALVVAILLLTVTSGLGVLALLEIPLAAILIGSSVLERRARRRRSLHGPSRSRSPSPVRSRSG